MAESEQDLPQPASWLEEAHRRADRSEDAAWREWDRRKRIPRVEVTAGAVASVVGFAWFTLRGAVDVSSNPWQGLMLDGAYPVPVFAALASGLVDVFAPPTGIVILNVAARVLGALACAGIAVITVNAARRVCSAGEAWVCGVMAGALFALAPGVTSAYTGAWPGAITICVGIWGLAALGRGIQSRSAAVWLILGAALCGAASANHAFFAWLAIPLFASAVWSLRRGAIKLRSALFAVLTWAALVIFPAIYAIGARGEPLDFFLGRVLRGPYPAVAERVPDWERLVELAGEFHPMVWLISAAAAILLFQRHARLPVAVALAIAAIAGPFAPFLTNDYDSGAFPRDEISVQVMAIAGCGILFGMGVAAALQIVFRRGHSLGYRAATASLAFAIIALHQWSIAPDRRNDLSGEFAQALLDGCPRESVLIVRDPAIAGMAVAAQQAYSHRRDVRVLPMGVLTNSAARRYYRHSQPAGVHIDAHYDTEQHADAWQRERPLVTNVLMSAESNSRERVTALDDLILWEFVRDNFSARPIAFAGVEAEWLLARAEVNGLVQVYPRTDAPLTNTMEAWLALKAANHERKQDPALSEAFAEILLSLSATRRAQDQGEDATRLAALATQYDKGEPRGWLALARAAARSGSREDAEIYSAVGLHAANGDTERVGALLQSDFEAYDLVERYRASLERAPDDAEARNERDVWAADLWMRDEIAALAVFLERELESDRVTVRDLYELAAVQAQLGKLEDARRYLVDAIAIAPREVLDQLESDGQFVLLEFDHLPSPNQTSL